MKLNILCTIASLGLIFSAANATTRTVTCQNSPSHYLPVTLNAVVGDTVLWVWVAGTHVVGPILTTDIPAGAAMFDAPIDASNHSFKYVLKVAGNYHYVCHPATPHGEDAYIVVTAGATGIQPNMGVPNISTAYPNPFADKLTIETPNGDHILIYNEAGQQLKSFPLKSGQTKFEADLADLPKGIYFYMIMKEGLMLENKKIIKG
jgi:plastocyanin